MTLMLTFIIFLSFIALLAIGVVFSRRPIKSRCCEASKMEQPTVIVKSSKSESE